MCDSSPIIVTAANSKYCLPLAVMLKSLEENLSDDERATIYILIKQFDTHSMQEVEASFEANKLQIHWIVVNESRLGGLKVDGHISIDTYYRLLIEELFPQHSKVIYLDADMIVNRSICGLWDTEFEGKHLLATPIAAKESGFVSGTRGIPSYKILGIPGDTRTFNAGVMVLNLDLWRRDSVSDMVFEYLRKHMDYVLWWDQDGLNAILHEKWLPLPAIWNVMTGHLDLFSTWEDSLLTPKEFDDVWNLPGIIHYAGPSKPWLPNYGGPFYDIFLNYLNKLRSDDLKVAVQDDLTVACN
jgi:lipopolysaccharide biosynthesis glycosyltransferase